MSFVHKMYIGYFDIEEAMKYQKLVVLKKISSYDIITLQESLKKCYEIEMNLESKMIKEGVIIVDYLGVPLSYSMELYSKAYPLACLAYFMLNMNVVDINHGEIIFPEDEKRKKKFTEEELDEIYDGDKTGIERHKQNVNFREECKKRCIEFLT